MNKTFVRGSFGRGNGGTYTCRICGKLTRDTGRGEGSLQQCAFCLETGELENTYQDGVCTEAEFEAGMAEIQKRYGRKE